jgi:anhydro-N-acetylmuramic acid kinase
MVIDALCQELFGLPMDKGGSLAAQGRVLEEVLAKAMQDPYFRHGSRNAPRTAGREQFGREYVRQFLRRCGKADKHDVLATATALTARSVGEAIRSLAKKDPYHDLFVSGGGTRNRTMMAMIGDEAAGLGIEVSSTDAAGVPSQAKEAIAFAVLAYQSWHRQSSNIPGATGAGREVILGKISYV